MMLTFPEMGLSWGRKELGVLLWQVWDTCDTFRRGVKWSLKLKGKKYLGIIDVQIAV